MGKFFYCFIILFRLQKYILFFNIITVVFKIFFILLLNY